MPRTHRHAPVATLALHPTPPRFHQHHLMSLGHLFPSNPNAPSSQLPQPLSPPPGLTNNTPPPHPPALSKELSIPRLSEPALPPMERASLVAPAIPPPASKLVRMFSPLPPISETDKPQPQWVQHSGVIVPIANMSPDAQICPCGLLAYCHVNRRAKVIFCTNATCTQNTISKGRTVYQCRDETCFQRICAACHTSRPRLDKNIWAAHKETSHPYRRHPLTHPSIGSALTLRPMYKDFLTLPQQLTATNHSPTPSRTSPQKGHITNHVTPLSLKKIITFSHN